MKGARFPIALFLILAFRTAPVAGYSASDYTFFATARPDTVTVGDRVTLRIVLERPSSDTSAVLPSLVVEPFTILEAPAAESIRDGDRVRLTQQLLVAAFQTGLLTIPAPTVAIVSTPGDTLSLSADPIDILVRSVRPSDAEDISDIRGPMAIEARIPLWAWGVLVLLIVLVALLVWWFALRKRPVPDAPPPAPPDWFREVRALADSGLLSTGDYLRFYTKLTEAFRRFIEDRTGVEAMESTTVELSRALEATAVGPGVAADVTALLSEADLVKFARSTPGQDRARADVQRALDAMRAIDAAVRPVTADSAEAPA